MTRRERLAVLLIALQCALVRIVAGRSMALDLLEAEELLNLRLARQLAAGLPLGDLSRYWYTGAGGNSGAGTWVLSWLYVPLSWLGELDAWAPRTMAVLWGIAGLFVLAWLGRELLGRGGAVAGAAAWATLPPAWIGMGSTAYGNYVEAAVLSGAAAAALLRCQRGRGAAAAGLLAGFTGWFSVAAAPVMLLLAVAAGFGRRIWFAGFVLGLGLWLLPIHPAGPPFPLDFPLLVDAFTGLVSAPARWPRFAHDALASVPILVFEDARLSWASPVLLELRHLWRAALWLGVWGLLGVAARGAFGWSRRTRAVVAALAVSAVAAPLFLGAIGSGPDYLGQPRVFADDPRRSSIVYLVQATGVAVFGHALWRRSRRWRVVLCVLGGLALAAGWAFATAADPPPQPFRPMQFLLCPAAEPVDEVSLCVDTLDEGQLPVLQRLVQRPALADRVTRRLALEAFDSVVPAADGCQLDAVPQGLEGWFAVGVSAQLSCEEPAAVCGEDPSGACDQGRAWLRSEFGDLSLR